MERLAKVGYAENAQDDDPKKMLVNRTGMAGFLQLYVMDSDRNIIEVNTAA